MKKILGIVVLVLLLSVNAYSREGYFLCDGLGKDRNIKDFHLLINVENETMFLAPSDFRLALQNRFATDSSGKFPKQVQVSTWWLTHPERREYKSVDFLPIPANVVVAAIIFIIIASFAFVDKRPQQTIFIGKDRDGISKGPINCNTRKNAT